MRGSLILHVAADAVGAGWLDGSRAAMAGFLVGLLATFLFVRINTRLIRAKVSWWFHDIESEGGTHVHHMVIGVVLMVTVGICLIALAPEDLLAQVLALLFGVGVALTLDEFALILNLQDVYWRKEGRLSVDAVIIVVCAAALFVLGINPFGDLGDPGLSGDVVPYRRRRLGHRRDRPGAVLPAQGQDLDRRARVVPAARGDRRGDQARAAQLAVGAPPLPEEAQEAGQGAAARGAPGRALDRLARRVLRPHRRQAAPAVAAAAGGPGGQAPDAVDAAAVAADPPAGDASGGESSRSRRTAAEDAAPGPGEET